MYLGLYQVVHARRETELSAEHKADSIGHSSTVFTLLIGWLRDVFFRMHR